MSEDTPVLRLVGISSELTPDAGISESRAIGTEDQLLRRNYVRAVFALIEGLNHARWHLAMKDPDVPAPTRDKAKAAAIRARRESKDLFGAGKIVSSTITSIAGLVAAYGSKNPLPDSDDVAWNDFIRAVEVRHRVTHPLTRGDCLVSDDDFALVQRVHHWYQDMDMRLMAPLTARGGVQQWADAMITAAPPSPLISVFASAQAWHHAESVMEAAAGRGMLSVLVVHKTGDLRPGKGFYTCAEQLRMDTSDPEKLWIDQLNKVYGTWSRP